jgi:hypothetical protein
VDFTWFWTNNIEIFHFLISIALVSDEFVANIYLSEVSIPANFDQLSFWTAALLDFGD